MKRRHFLSHSSLAGAAALTGSSALYANSVNANPGNGPVHADLIINNAKIYTMDDTLPVAQAVAVSGALILAVGSNEAVASLGGPNTKSIDGEGATVPPGISEQSFTAVVGLQYVAQCGQ